MVHILRQFWQVSIVAYKMGCRKRIPCWPRGKRSE